MSSLRISYPVPVGPLFPATLGSALRDKTKLRHYYSGHISKSIKFRQDGASDGFLATIRMFYCYY